MCPQIWPEINSLASRKLKITLKIAVFAKQFFCNNFMFSKGTTIILPESCFSCWDASNELWVDLKRSYCISFDPYRWPEHIYGVFNALSAIWSLSKVIAEKLLITFHDLKWPWRHGEGSLVAIFRLRVSSLPVTRCLRNVSNGFLPKEAPFIFLPLTYNGEVAKLTWPWVIDIKIRDIHFIDTVTAINRWKV